MTYIKTNSKWIEDINIRSGVTKDLEENIDNALIEVNLWNDSFGYESKSVGNKSKIRDERIQKSFYTAKEKISTVKCVTKEWEKICKFYIRS